MLISDVGIQTEILIMSVDLNNCFIYEIDKDQFYPYRNEDHFASLHVKKQYESSYESSNEHFPIQKKDLQPFMELMHYLLTINDSSSQRCIGDYLVALQNHRNIIELYDITHRTNDQISFVDYADKMIDYIEGHISRGWDHKAEFRYSGYFSKGAFKLSQTLLPNTFKQVFIKHKGIIYNPSFTPIANRKDDGEYILHLSSNGGKSLICPTKKTKHMIMNSYGTKICGNCRKKVMKRFKLPRKRY